MIVDHLSVGVDCVDKAADFYNPVLATLGIEQLARLDGLVGYGKDFIQFVAILPFNKEPACFGNGTHIAFHADTKEQVERFHQVALASGGRDEGAPGPRNYPHKEVYAAFVRDPFGHKLEVLTEGFSVSIP